MAILPEVSEGRRLRTCLEKNFLEVPGAGLEEVRVLSTDVFGRFEELCLKREIRVLRKLQLCIRRHFLSQRFIIRVG